MNISVFLGAPGSGKGTQAKRLAHEYGYRHFSTGDMLRSSIATGSETGLKAKAFIGRGELVPDDVMIELIEMAISQLPSNTRVILDGFPRTVPQAESLDSKPSTTVNIAAYFMVDEQRLINRLTGRRICQKCGESFHLLFLPPRIDGVCDKCGGPLIQRGDDHEGVVKRRLEVFNQQNTGLLSYYGKKKKLMELDATRSVDEVHKDLLRILQ